MSCISARRGEHLHYVQMQRQRLMRRPFDIAEIQAMLDSCGAHKVTADMEAIPIRKVNEAFGSLLTSNVKRRFAMDRASLNSGQTDE